MALSRIKAISVTLTTQGLDTEIKLAVDVDPALGFPNGLRCTATIPTTNGIDDVATFYLSAVPRTLSGITALQGSNLMKDIAAYAKSAAQLNYT